MIRPFAAEDGEAVVELLGEDVVAHALTGAGVGHGLASQPERAHARSWVAVKERKVVGWIRARLRWATSAAGAAELWAFVAPAYRRHGVGAELYEVAVRYLAGLEARSLESWSSSEDGSRFLADRGFRPVRTQRVLRLELANADLSGYQQLLAEKEADGYSLLPLAAVADRTRALHALDASATADVPATHAEDDFRYEDWLEETLAHPQLSREGSAVVLGGDEPVAYALVHVDWDARLAANEMTGTRADLRGRGLARLAKLATIAWALEQGFEAILTATDSENVPMLGLNESLGYEAVAIETEYLLEDLR